VEEEVVNYPQENKATLLLFRSIYGKARRFLDHTTAQDNQAMLMDSAESIMKPTFG
jgi:hypothetical protein